MTLLDSLCHESALLPTELQDIAADFLKHIQAKLDSDLLLCFENPVFASSVLKVCICSQFISETWLRNPELIPDLVSSGDLLSSQRRQAYSDVFQNVTFTSDADLLKKLRLFRRREMLRIAWRDLAGWSDLNETLNDLSLLAEACIETALTYFYQQACQRWGTPKLANGNAFNLVVLGMGKLGAWELNFSSDIDLIFAYAEDGILTEKKEISHGEFFTRICQLLIRSLDEITADGFVFRTDVRLRPFGDSGPLVMSFDGMERYYLSQAREWERYAMIKARQVAGDWVTGKQLAAMIKPFVYRRYLDYGAFEELRSLKCQIMQELKRKDRMENIKLGPGGIREVEFIGQAFQLIRGGRDTALQQREIQVVLDVLLEQDFMSIKDVTLLKFAYRFLRRIENHIQQFADKQCHDLPTEPLQQHILAYSLDFDNWNSFKEELDQIREQVHSIFAEIFSLPEQESEQQNMRQLWTSPVDDENSLDSLAELGFTDPTAILTDIVNFKESNAVKRLSNKGMSVMQRLIPAMMQHLVKVDNQEITLKRILDLFEAVAGRNVYLSLLAENPQALTQLITLASSSLWICEYLAQYPILFDELLYVRSLYEPLQKSALIKDLARELSKIDPLDEEQLMIALRQFKHVNLLRVAAADIMDEIPVVVVSAYLTWIAETILDQVLNQAWQILGNKHGYPPDCGVKPENFAIIAFGKFGGKEMGYGSDLDLMFLYCNDDDNAMTSGEKPIDCGLFYLRLAQKIRHILYSKMLSGILYEVDLRLRPNGDSGLLVTHIDHYEAYLKEQAWTWEHQALVRGRFIVGDYRLQTEYEGIRARILSLPRNYAQLKNEVREMRTKMRENLGPNTDSIFDLKQSKGGIADIEFIVQFGVLAEAAKNPDLIEFTSNIRLLECLKTHRFISESDAEVLIVAYCSYRDYGHHQVLQGQAAIVDSHEFAKMRSQVEEIWQTIME